MLPSVPTYVSWNYTYSCNLSCDHCYSRADWYPEELPTEAYRTIASHLVDIGVIRVGLGGGEPLIRNDAVEILELLGAGGIDTNITTNAWFLDQAMADRLADVGLGTLHVSLDAPNANEHDQIRREGSFNRVVTGITHTHHAGLRRIVLSTVITRKNVHHMPAFVALARELGVFGIEFKRFRPVGNGQKNAEAFTLDGQDETLHDIVRSLKADVPDVRIDLIYSVESEGAQTDVDSGCPCGRRSLTLRPNGTVAVCAYSSETLGKLPDDDLGVVWREHPSLVHVRSGRSCAGLRPQPSPVTFGAALKSTRVHA